MQGHTASTAHPTRRLELQARENAGLYKVSCAYSRRSRSHSFQITKMQVIFPWHISRVACEAQAKAAKYIRPAGVSHTFISVKGVQSGEQAARQLLHTRVLPLLAGEGGGVDNNGRRQLDPPPQPQQPRRGDGSQRQMWVAGRIRCLRRDEASTLNLTYRRPLHLRPRYVVHVS